MPDATRWITDERIIDLKDICRRSRGDILKMTTLAGSGHPGGSMSSIDIFITLYSFARVGPKQLETPDRDRVVVSHGHTSPGVYAALGRLGFFNVDEAVATFRLAGSPFEGHVERSVPGVEWSSGNLGQGLSAGCGFAIAGRLADRDYHVFVAMSDAEQAKGQVAEARRFANKYNLSNVTVIVDYNERQISGKTHDVMPVNISEGYVSDNWKVIDVDGHDLVAIRNALVEAVSDASPTVIIAKTIMGKGVSFMEGDEEYHGRALKTDEYRRAMQELGLQDDIAKYQSLRQARTAQYFQALGSEPFHRLIFGEIGTLRPGEPRTYKAGSAVEARVAFGNALMDIAEANSRDGMSPMAVFDCDLAKSVMTNEFAKRFPRNFFEVGVQEHTAATIAGVCSVQGAVPFFADFGVFGLDETYNQHRLNDINETNLKLVLTHCGLNVGEDGKTHQCLDYVGVARNLFGFNIIVPADANQTDRATRYIASRPGNYLLAIGRSKLPIIVNEEGAEAFAGSYTFEYGKAEVLRKGKDAAILSMGTLVHKAICAAEKLKEDGFEVMVVNVSSPNSIDKPTLKAAVETGSIVTYEDHNVNTGLGASIMQAVCEFGFNVKVKRLGVQAYASSGAFEDLYRIAGLDEGSLANQCCTLIR